MVYDPDTLLTIKQPLTDINKSCRKAALSDGGLLIQRQTKENDAYIKSVHANLPIPKQNKSKIMERVTRSTNYMKNSVR